MAAGARFRVASDYTAQAARLPSTQRNHPRGVFAWSLLLTALLVLPWSSQIAAFSTDALQRAAAATADLMRQKITTDARAAIASAAASAAAGAPAAAQPVARGGIGQAAAATSAPRAATGAAAAQPASTPVPVKTSVPQNAPTPGPTTAPVANTVPAQTAAPTARAAATTAPTVAPTAAPTAAPTVAPTAAPTSAPTAAPTTVPLPGVSVALPRAPTTYTVPASALRVATASELTTALNGSTARDISLADGVYDSAGPFMNVNGHRIYSARLGGAVLKAGLVMGGNSGPGNGLVQGLTFDVSDPAKTLQNSIIHVWGTGAGSRIFDTTLNGNRAIASGINVRNPEGSVLRRVQIRNFTSYGLIADTGSQNKTLAVPMLLEDIDVSGVSRAVPKSSNGTAEACIWMGNTGTLRRARVSDCSWMGIWTGTSNKNSLLEDLTIDRTMVGVYLEHYTTGSTFQRLRVGPSVLHGLVCEWADPSWGSRPGCTDDIIQDSTFMSSDVGVLLDDGTTRTTVRRVKFIGQARAAIYDPRGDGNTYSENDYSEIDGSAVPVEDNFLSF